MPRTSLCTCPLRARNLRASARRGVAQPGSALALGARCRRFESCLPDQFQEMADVRVASAAQAAERGRPCAPRADLRFIFRMCWNRPCEERSGGAIQERDRKGGVEGKSVYVRVDLGGCRTIKQ